MSEARTEVEADAAATALDEARCIVDHGAARRVGQIAAPVLRDLGYRLVRVKISGADGATVQIMAERSDGSMTIDDCERASGALSPVFDLEDPVSQAYRLEISSPGIDRPLVRISDFERAVGHEAKIEMATPIETRKRFRGVIEAVEDGAAAVRLPDGEREAGALALLPIRDMAEARLVLTDELIRATLRREKAAEKQRRAGAARGSYASRARRPRQEPPIQTTDET
jgi:ribosome maturation factor RimP